MDNSSTCKENLNIIIAHYPFSESLNKKIIEDCDNYLFYKTARLRDGSTSNIHALQTRADNPLTDNIILLQKWIINVLSNEQPHWEFLIWPWWIANYDEGDYTEDHCHDPAPFSFVYFVQSPKDSSPLVFTTSGKNIEAEEGKVVIFPGNLRHHVPENKCDGRMILSGNLFPMMDPQLSYQR